MRVPTLLDKDGVVWLNPARRFAVGTVLAPNPDLIPIVAPAMSGGNPGSAPPILLEGAQNAVSEVYGLVGEHDASENSDVGARLSVRIQDLAYRRTLMNRDILVDHVFGNYQLPFVLKETIGLESQQNLLFNFLNNSTAGASSYRMAARGLKIESSEETAKLVESFANELRIRKTFCMPYWITSDVAISLSSSQKRRYFFSNTKDQTLILFYIMAATIYDSSGAAGDTQEQFACKIYEGGTSRLLMNQAVTKNMVGGTAQKPYLLPMPLYLLPNNQIEIEFENLLTNKTLEIFFTFHGVSVYDGVPIWNQPGIQVAVPVADRE